MLTNPLAGQVHKLLWLVDELSAQNVRLAEQNAALTQQLYQGELSRLERLAGVEETQPASLVFQPLSSYDCGPTL